MCVCVSHKYEKISSVFLCNKVVLTPPRCASGCCFACVTHANGLCNLVLWFHKECPHLPLNLLWKCFCRFQNNIIPFVIGFNTNTALFIWVFLCCFALISDSEQFCTLFQQMKLLLNILDALEMQHDTIRRTHSPEKYRFSFNIFIFYHLMIRTLSPNTFIPAF